MPARAVDAVQRNPSADDFLVVARLFRNERRTWGAMLVGVVAIDGCWTFRVGDSEGWCSC